MDETRIKTIEDRLSKLEGTNGISREMGPLDKRVMNDVVSDDFHNTLWNGTFYIASFATASITTTTSELLDANGRESDTSAGKLFRPERTSRFRCSFYLNTNQTSSTVYIASPGISTSASIGTAIRDSAKKFVGVKIVAGVLSLVSWNGAAEKTVPTSVVIANNITHILEIDYYITHATVIYDGAVIGDIACDLSQTTFEVFFPFITSVGSNDAVTSVNMTMENYEFLQRRK